MAIIHPAYDQLAEYSSDFSLQAVDPEIIRRAKLLVLDSISAIVHGNRTPEPLRFSEQLSHLPNGGLLASVYGTELKLPPHLSAMANALGMVSQEMDEGNPIAKGHPSCHFFPAVLAIAESERRSGLDLLESFIVGYEIGARAGASITLKSSVHPHGNWGMLGSAFAVGKMSGFTKEQFINSLFLSGSLPGISLWKPVIEGHRIRDVHVGLNNLNAMLLPALLGAGYSSSPAALEEIYGGIIGQQFVPDRLVDGIGDQYLLMKTYFKFYPYCRFCHAPLDAVQQILSKSQLELEEIDQIQVFTYSLAARLDEQQASNSYAGKFSIPYTLAGTLLSSEKDIQTVNGLAQKIFVYEDPEYSRLLPNERKARVVIFTKSGKQLQHEVHGASGDAGETGLEDRVIEKCRRLLAETSGWQKADALVERVMNLEQVSDMKALLEFTMP